MKANGIVKGTATDIGAMLLIVLLYPVSPMQYHRVIGCWCCRKGISEVSGE